MDTQEQDRPDTTGGKTWELNPIAVEGVKVLRTLLETEASRLREQYEAVDPADESFDDDAHIDWWISDIREAADALGAVDATPEVDES